MLIYNRERERGTIKNADVHFSQNHHIHQSFVREDSTGTGLKSLIFLFPIDFHFIAAGTGFHWPLSGPSIEILIKLSNIDVVRRFRSGVFVLVMVENTFYFS